MESLREMADSVYRTCSPYTSHILTCIALVAFLVVICKYTPTTPTTEGFVANVSPTIQVEDIVGRNEKLETVLDTEKHADEYKSIVENMKHNINLTMLREIVKNTDTISGNPVSRDGLQSISNINSLNAFDDALTKTLENM